MPFCKNTILVIITAFLVSCASNTKWTKLEPVPESVVDQAKQVIRVNKYVADENVWEAADIIHAQTREDFQRVLNILPHGIHTRAGNNNRHSAFSYAVLLGKSEHCLEYLLERGADIDQLLLDQGETPLHLAVMRGDIDTVRFLLDNGADANHRDIYAFTPIFKCAIYTKDQSLKQMFDLLLDAGANPNVYRDALNSSNSDRTPYEHLQHRAQGNNEGVVNALLERLEPPPTNF